MIKYVYSEKATKFEKIKYQSAIVFEITYLSQVFQLLCIFDQSKCLAVLHFDWSNSQKAGELKKLEMPSALVT